MPWIDLPLFPLGSVLLPTMPLPLHIFEARYREMIGFCLQQERRFGVVLIREGHEVGETASPYGVGTVAVITAAARLEDGRLHIITEGRQRFRIRELFFDRAYLHGAVDFLDDPVGLPENVAPLAVEARTLALRYVEALLKMENQEGVGVQLPSDPLELSYKLAGLLQVPKPEQQALLEADNAEARLRAEILALRRELAILGYISSMPPPADRRSFNSN